MSELRVETVMMRASVLGGDNPLPDLRTPRTLKAQVPFDLGASADNPRYVEETKIRGCLPYRVQDGYDRSEAERPVQVAVLESRHVRATFLLELGGRLWSLVHKPTGRELLYQPRVLHFGNLALRNAWFCGGVEWNIAVRGHTAHTCSGLFAAEVRADDGSPVLRLYEWDRFRGLLFQIDATAPEDLPALLIRPRAINTQPVTVPMYWWSNIAVPERPGHRVIAPAEMAHQFAYTGEMETAAVPYRDGTDVSYPTNIPSAHDYFYSIPAGRRPWIAALDEQGAGLVQASTARLLGRKLFVWGMGPGGRRWQEHLSGQPGGYVEIQAGLAPTQAHYVPMPARADWSWLEAYMLMEADPAIAHGQDWQAAYGHVRQRLDAALPQERLEAMLVETAGLADRPPRKVLVPGSGWGALEKRRRRLDGEPAAVPPGMVFDESSLTDEQAPWLALLEQGALPCSPPDQTGGSWMVGATWRRRLADSARDGEGDHWLTWLHLGVAAFHDGDLPAARQAWERSVASQPSAWACRNLAVLARTEGRTDPALELYLQAAELMPGLLELQVECGRALAEAKRFDDLVRWLGALPEALRDSGRIQMLSATAAVHQGDLDRAESLLEAIELHDVREGEVTLTDLWFDIQARRIAAAENVPLDEALQERVRQTCRPPSHLDFRMSQQRQPAKS